jgi:hypothetical protein
MRHGVGLAGARHTQQHLMMVTAAQAIHKLGNGVAPDHRGL